MLSMNLETRSDMKVLNYEFGNKEDRETAFNNIVKWYGEKVVTKVDFLELNIEATQEVLKNLKQIAEKHFGRIKADIIG
jgi:SepF-like predicted cell division protein (DUF552 family)